MSIDTATPRPKKRRWRGLLIVACAALLVAVLVGVDAHRRDLRRDALATVIQRAGGYAEQPKPLGESIEIWRKTGRFPSRRTFAQLSGATFNNHWIREHDYLRDFDFRAIHCDSITGDDLARLIDTHPLEVLHACDIVLTDEVLRAIQENSTLTLLALGESRYTDEQFARLPLERLDHLSPIGVTADGILQVRRCRNLTGIGVDGVQLTDALAEVLASLGTVNAIYLNDRALSDDHLGRLHRISTLKRVILFGPEHTTQAGRDALVAALPGCKIEMPTVAVDAESAE